MEHPTNPTQEESVREDRPPLRRSMTHDELMDYYTSCPSYVVPRDKHAEVDRWKKMKAENASAPRLEPGRIRSMLRQVMEVAQADRHWDAERAAMALVLSVQGTEPRPTAEEMRAILLDTARMLQRIAFRFYTRHGRPPKESTTTATRMKEQGASWKDIYRALSIGPDRLEQIKLRDAVRARRNLRRKRAAHPPADSEQ